MHNQRPTQQEAKTQKRKIIFPRGIDMPYLPRYPLAMIGNFVIFSCSADSIPGTFGPGTSKVEMINLSELTPDEKEDNVSPDEKQNQIKFYTLNHGNVLAAAPLYFGGCASGLVTASDDKVTIWKDEAALAKDKSSSTIPLENKPQLKEMRVFHIPDTDEIIVVGKNIMDFVKVHPPSRSRLYIP